MQAELLDHKEKELSAIYTSKNANSSIAKGIIGIVTFLALIVFYFWCTQNMIVFSSGRANQVVQGYVIYGTLLLSYSILSIILGRKKKDNSQRACLRLEFAITILQLAIAILLLIDWWFTFEIRVL